MEELTNADIQDNQTVESVLAELHRSRPRVVCFSAKSCTSDEPNDLLDDTDGEALRGEGLPLPDVELDEDGEVASETVKAQTLFKGVGKRRRADHRCSQEVRSHR